MNLAGVAVVVDGAGVGVAVVDGAVDGAVVGGTVGGGVLVFPGGWERLTYVNWQNQRQSKKKYKDERKIMQEMERKGWES